MKDIKVILQENFEDYDLECQKTRNYIEEKDPDFLERSRYAGYLEEPVREKQILFWSRGLKNCVDVPRYLFEQIYRMYGQEYTYICVGNKKNKSAESLQERVTFVKKNSAEFWRALACSKYLIGNTVLPKSFVKREGQIYINSMTGIPAFFQKKSVHVSQHSYIAAEMLKTDYLISDSKWMAERICMGEYQLSGIYGGKIVMPGNIRVSYMKQQIPLPSERTKCVLLVKEKAKYEWMKEHLQELETEDVEICLAREYNCCFGGTDICDLLVGSDVVIGDNSNYLRDAKEYGCKVCCMDYKDSALGFEEYDRVSGWEELKNYVKENSGYRRKETDAPINAAERLVEYIFGNAGNDLEIYGCEGNPNTKKRVLFLAEWDLPRKQRNFIRRIVEETDCEKYDVTVATQTVTDDYLNQEWAGMPEEIRRLCYRGRRVMTEEEYILFRFCVKEPFLYLKHKEIREAMNHILEKEWKRRWGELPVDYIVLCGQRTGQYFTVAGSHASEKILASETLMPFYRQKNVEEWQKALEIFDKIYLLPVGFRQSCMEYGTLNQEKTVKHKLLFPKTLMKKDEIEHAVIAGSEYLVADKWSISEEREQMCLVQMPVQGTCILNTELVPDEKRIAFLRKNLEDKQCVLFLGENFEEYRPYISCECRRLEDIVWQELYMLPTAGEYFSRIDFYAGDDRLEDDAMKEICEKYHVRILT